MIKKTPPPIPAPRAIASVLFVVPVSGEGLINVQVISTVIVPMLVMFEPLKLVPQKASSGFVASNKKVYVCTPVTVLPFEIVVPLFDLRAILVMLLTV
jgi:hypothetical protein